MDFIRVIMDCITSVSMRILWNGELTESFSLSRGIRQGDPLSPYIFMLCIECLSHGINQAVREGKWKPIRLRCNSTPITNLFFADDRILLAEAFREHAAVINDVLDSFCTSSSEKVNRTKTQVFFFRNVDSGEACKIS